MNESNNNHETASGTKPVLAPVFDAIEYAYDHWGETLGYMSDDEIVQVNDCENKDEVDDYLRCFYEHT